METLVRKRSNLHDQEDEASKLISDFEKTETIIPVNGNYISQNGTKISQEKNRYHKTPLHLRTVRVTLYGLYKILNVAYVPLFIYRVFERREKCSPVTDSVLRITATDLAKKIRRKEISCEQVVQSYIRRIKEVNPLINAVIDERFAEAIEDAKKVDALVSTDNFLENEEDILQKYPLLGIPVSVKGSIAVKGLKYTSGTVLRKDYRAEEDADIVDLLRQAGAIPLLVSNVPELCMSWETTNKLIGTTKNPHDSTRTCGGSSGGEASLLSSGASLIGVGSDIAGSLRLPAHYCGVWGHKPTPEVVSFDGHYPSCSHRKKWGSIFTLGPMARYATDLRAVLQVITIPEKRKLLNLDKKVDIRKVKIYYSEHEDYYWQKTNSECRGAVKKAVEYFSKICDTKPVKINFHVPQSASDLTAFEMLFTENIEGSLDNAKAVFAEIFRYLTFRSKRTFMVIACGLLQIMAQKMSDGQKTSIQKFLAKKKEHYEQMLGHDGVIIMPPFPTEAPKHGDVLRTALNYGYLSIFNSLGFPVTNCPIGVTSKGLPVGVQVAAVPYGDNLTLAIAEEIEKAFGGWIEPSSH